MNKYNDRLCIRPFLEIAIEDNGDVYNCCPGWVNMVPLGNLLKSDFNDIWNGEHSQQFRQAVHDGNFKFCNENTCAHLFRCDMFVFKRADDIPIYKEDSIKNILRDDFDNKRTVLNHGPLIAMLAYDKSCNLHCTSCRKELFLANQTQNQTYKNNINIIHSKIKPFLKDLRMLHLNGSGEALVSEIFTDLLYNSTYEDFPNLDNIFLLSNGTVIKQTWDKISPFIKYKLHDISISLDGCTKEVYEKIRVGSNFENVLSNIEFVQNVIRPNWFGVSIVIQKDNYFQLVDYIKFLLSYNIKNIQFQILEPDFRLHEDISYFYKWKENAIHEETHPLYEDFLCVLKSAYELILKHSELNINYGPVYKLILGQSISKLEVIKQRWNNMFNNL